MSPRKNKKDTAAQTEAATELEGAVATAEADASADMSIDDGFGGSMSVRKAEHFWPSAKRLLGLLAPFKLALSAVFALVAISVVFNVVAPKVMGRAMDIIAGGLVGRGMPSGVTKEQLIAGLRAEGKTEEADRLNTMVFTPGQGIDFVALGNVLLVVLTLYVLASLFMWAQGWLLNKLVMRVVRGLRRDVEAKLNRLPLNYFDTRQRGDVLSRVTNDVDNIQQSLQQALSQLVSAVMTVIGIIIMMFVVSWQLALIALVALPLTGVIMAGIGKPSQKRFVAQWQATGALNGQIEESFSGHELVKVFGREEDMRERFEERNESLFKAAFSAQALSMSMMPIMTFVSYLSYVGIAVVGGLRVAAGQMSLGDATAFIQYSRQFTQPLSEIAGVANMFQSGVAAAERTFELLDADEEEQEEPSGKLPARTEGRVQFQNVSFSYSEDKPLIEDLSFEADPGHTVAIVGPTGAGKTTLVNLVMRFYEINSGRILLDGVDTKELSRQELRSKVGMVLQDAWLFGGTIMENIRYGRLEATDEEVIAAAKATYVDRFVRALPDGYDTVLDEDATNVSAGERQLITIARAFVSDPSLLILDEATSSVDTRTELLVQQAMKALRSDRTSFVIAHRLSTIRDADTILVMEAGRIVEQGNHEQLLAARGAYHRLYMSQFVGPADTEVAEEERQAAEAEVLATGSVPVVTEDAPAADASQGADAQAPEHGKHGAGEPGA
ncbi:ABC transporter ATP-binding protein [Galactobacter valiniphilus]|uniref:Fatty acid ABC transporter ATP-binding/permease protein n=1 Tax=Galactobacter valiniphilus TaxID=2676122 RepID=A0A399JCF3_9MICC|nr:ABC transporter ATP-binding protein [Galactobacter valiniphilus]RII42237.1 ABC transporter ATP-binding protein [Galactobacter valiniphilus]